MTRTFTGYGPLTIEKPNSGGTFRVLVGSHLGKGPEGCRCDDCTRGFDHVYRSHETHVQIAVRAGRIPTSKRSYTGDIVLSETDMVARLGNKFERVAPEEAAQLLALRAEQLGQAETPKAAKPRATTGGA